MYPEAGTDTLNVVVDHCW